MRLSCLLAALLAALPSVVWGSVGLVLKGPSRGNGQDLVVGRAVHALDVKADGLEYFVAIRIRDQSFQFGSAPIDFGLVVPLPRRPDEVGVVAAGIFAGLDAATSGVVLPCPSKAASGCASTSSNNKVPPPSPEPAGAPAFNGTEGANVPLSAHALPGSASEAVDFFKREKLTVTNELSASLEALYQAGSVALVLHYSEDPRDAQQRQGSVRGATVRATFKGMTPPFAVPLSFHPGPLDGAEVETSLIVLTDARQATLTGAEVLPIDVKTVPSPQPVEGSGKGGTAVQTDRGGVSCCGENARPIDTAVRQTLGSKAGRAFILETAQYLREASVAVGLPACTFGDQPDEEGCQVVVQQPCKGCEPGNAFDAGLPSEDGGEDAGQTDGGGTMDGGVSDAGVPLGAKERTSNTLPRMFPRDRFVTRFTSLSPLSALQGTAMLGLGEDAASVGPGYLNCPPVETGCASAAGPVELGFVLFALALLRRRARP